MIPSYPEPELPIRPILSFASFSGTGDASIPSVEDSGRSVWVTSGRIAIALGLQCEGIGTGNEVLLPAYNCSTIVKAVEVVGAKPVFYKSFADLSPDMEDIEAKISMATKAVLVVHFFGFPQKIEVIHQFCCERNLVLIEDCAHSYFSQYHGRPLGCYGDFAITSAMKFFPVSDGGCLVFSPDKDYTIPLRSGGLGFEAKSFINDLEWSARYNRLKPFTWLLKLSIILKDWIWSALKRRSPPSLQTLAGSNGGNVLGPESSYGGYCFDTGWMDVRISRFSRLIVKKLPRARMIEIRRKNFKCFLEALSDYENARPLFSELPDGVVPYVFPLLVSSVERVFPVLKRAGVPILRWEYLDRSVCEVSARYSTELLQFPCHQEISTRELNWIIDQIRSALIASG